MSANKSRRQVRHAILFALVSSYSAWDLLAECPPCGRYVQVPMAQLAQHLTITAVVRQLRCARCQKPPEAVALLNRLPGQRECMVKLVGTGAYQ
jgi:hypothetical protein